MVVEKDIEASDSTNNFNIHFHNNGKDNAGKDNDAYSINEDDVENKVKDIPQVEFEPENKSNINDTTKKKTEIPPAVSVGQLFRYATKLDVLFMVLGSIAAVGNGVAQPISFIFFGKLIDKFIEKDSGKNIDIEDEMTTFAIYYIYVAIATIVCGYLQNTLWLLASIRQAFVIRTGCYKAVLRQDIGWFDCTDSGEISTRMTDDITKIQTGIGDKIGSLIQAVSMLLGGFVIGFIYSWKLTLVIIAMTPLIGIAAFGTGKVVGIITSQEQTSYAKAGAIAEEVLSSIRTVVAFGGEEKEIQR